MVTTTRDANDSSWDELIGELEGKSDTDVQIALLAGTGSREIPLELREDVKSQMKGRAFKGIDDRVPMYGPKAKNQGWVQSLIPKSQVMFRMRDGFTLRRTQDAPENTEPCNTLADDGVMCMKMFRNILHRMAHIRRYHQMASEVLISQEDIDRLSGKLVSTKSVENPRLAELEAQLTAAMARIEQLELSKESKKKLDQ